MINMEKKSVKDIDNVAFKNALVEALHTPLSGYGCRGGCGRVYVEIVSPKITKSSKLGKIIQSLGLLMTSRPYYGGSSRIYVGYDNASGQEYKLGEIIEEKLKAVGVQCYVDGDGD